MKKLLLVAIGLVLCASAFAAPPATYTPGEAAAAGKGDGTARNPTTSSNISTAVGTATVPSYNTTPPEGAYFGGGNGNVSGPTTAKLAACAGSNTAECVAVNLMQFKASNANPITINPLDPLVVNARSVTKTPVPTLGPTAGIFTAPPPPSACPPAVTTSGTGSVIETCESQGIPTSMTCVKPWLLNIQPWWTYTCEKSNITLVTSTCSKILNVAVNWVPNCTVGEVIATGLKPWNFHSRHCGFWGCDAGYWDNGGAVLAYCDPALPTSINFSYGGTGYVNCGEFGSNPDQSQGVPAPQPNLAAHRPVTLPTTITQAISLPNEAMDVVVGSGCAADGTCSYTFHIGDGTWGCAGGGLIYNPGGYCGYSCGNTPPWLSTTTTGPNPGAACWQPSSAYAPIVIGSEYGNPVYGCNAGDILNGASCWSSAGAQPATLIGTAPGTTFSMTFQKPRLVPQITETTVSTCDSLESSPQCTVTGSTCLEGPSTKNINGVDVERQCWNTKYDWQCKSAAGPNWCQPLTSEPLCAQVDVNECLSYSVDGTCISYRAGYKCTKDMGPPPNVTQTGSGYTITQDQQDVSQCASLSGNVNCHLTGSICTDTADKTFFGFTFSRDCWSTQDTYTCPGSATSTCQPLIDKGCSVLPTRTTCINKLPDGSCDTTQYYYECGSPVSTTTTPTTCDSTPYCINGVCYDTSRPSDPDFFKAVAMTEAAREGGNYIDKATFLLFKGEADYCTRRALVNCCKGNGAPSASLTNKAMYTAIDFGRAYMGSMYMYDTLFTSSMPDFLVSGLESLGVTSAVGANTFSAYGVTIGWGEAGFEIVGFDPWSFVIAVVIQIVVTELMSCEDGDKITAVKKDQGLCYNVGSWCSSKFLGMCAEHREGYCCFNSKLAKAINIQGKKQLGISLGSPQQPFCAGLTMQQVQSLDFNLIDLSEFIASVTANAIGQADAVASAITRLTNPNVPPGPPPTPSGGPISGPPEPPPPGPPPLPPEDVNVTAAFAPSTVSVGSQITLQTATTGATSLTFACTGAVVATGSIAVGNTTTVWTALPEYLGESTCTFEAVGPYARASTVAILTVTQPAPTITASFSPSTVSGGATLSMNTSSANADSVEYSCTGASQISGYVGIGNVVTPIVSKAANLGVTNCTFTARDGIGRTATATASFTVVTTLPTVDVAVAPQTVMSGESLTVTTNTTNAVTLLYECTGGLKRAGTLPIGTNQVTTLVTDLSMVGTTSCTLTALSATNDSGQATFSFTVNSSVLAVTASATPSTVNVGQTISINSSTSNAVSLGYVCTGAFNASGSLPVGASQVTPLATTPAMVGVTNCTLTATSSTGTTAQAKLSFIVSLSQGGVVPTVTAAATPSSVTVGQPINISTSTSNAISLEYACTGAVNSSGTLTVGASQAKTLATSVDMIGTTTCTLTATSSTGNTAQASLSFTVNAPIIPTLTATASPPTVFAGQTININTSTTDAVSLGFVCTGAYSASGSLPAGASQVTPLVTGAAMVGGTNCTLTATSSTGNTAQASLSFTVNPAVIPTVSASASPSVVTAGETININTSTSTAVSLGYVCTGAYSASGSLPTGASQVTALVTGPAMVGATSCTLTATSTTGNTAQTSIGFTVNSQVVVPTISASAVPSTVTAGQTINVTTSTSNAVSLEFVCTGAYSGYGSLPTGTSQVTPFTTSAAMVGATSCTLTATSSTGGTAQTSVSFTVNPGAPPPTVSASASPSTVTAGQTINVTTSTSNAVSLEFVCTGAYSGYGSLPTGTSQVTPFTTSAAMVGATSCTLTATSSTGGTAQTSVSFTVNPGAPPPTVSASASPSTVTAGQTISITTSTSNAVSLEFVCTGAFSGSGSLPTGASQVTPVVTSAAMIGTTSCTLTATSATGNTAQTSVAFTVI